MLDRWYFTDLPTARAASGVALQAAWEAQNTRKDASAQAFSSPIDALRAAIAAADTADRIVIFGSFYTVGGILQEGIPRLQSAHLGS
jgi:dihydrofolate synthase/folylpolyglutamate synthase